jgi:hypothetical protein
VVRPGLTLGILENVARVVRRLTLGPVLGARRVVIALLIMMGHIRTNALEETRTRREGEREDGEPFYNHCGI